MSSTELRESLQDGHGDPAATVAGNGRAVGHPSRPSTGGSGHNPIPSIRKFNSHSERRRLYRDARGSSDRARQAELTAHEKAEAADSANTLHDTIRDRGLGLRRHAPRLLMLTIAIVLTSIDFLACYLAAEVFGGDRFTTIVVAVLLLAGLACGEAALDAASQHGARKVWRRTAVLVAAFILTLGVLRFYYLVTVGDGLMSALIEAAVLTAVTAGLVALATWALRVAETAEMAQARHAAKAAGREAEAAEAKAAAGRDEREQLHDAYLRQIHPQLIDDFEDLKTVQEIAAAIRAHLRETTVELPSGAETVS